MLTSTERIQLRRADEQMDSFRFGEKVRNVAMGSRRCYCGCGRSLALKNASGFSGDCSWKRSDGLDG